MTVCCQEWDGPLYRAAIRGGICPSRQCRRQCKIFASCVNFSIFTHFLCFFLLKLLKLGEIDGVKFLAWKSDGVKFLTNPMSDDKESGGLFFLNSRDRPIMIWRNNKCINTGWLHPPPLSHRSLDAKEQWQCSHHHQDTWYRRYPVKVSNLQIRWLKFSFSSLTARQQQELR